MTNEPTQRDTDKAIIVLNVLKEMAMTSLRDCSAIWEPEGLEKYEFILKAIDELGDYLNNKY